MKILVIGAGNMGLAYAEAMTKSPLIGDEKIMILEKDEAKIEQLKVSGKFKVFDSIESCIASADIVFLAIKPYHSDDVFATLKPLINKEQIFVSIMAGVTIQRMESALGTKKVVRAMPNLPAQIGKGVTSYTASELVTEKELLNVAELLKTTGTAIHVSNEQYIDASTGISGSGPAYVFYFMQSMIDAAIKMGFSAFDSKTLVSKTFEGAIALFNESDISPQEWMDRVSSKGGTTIAALESMDSNKLNKTIKEAAYASFNRATEIGKE